MSRLEGWYEQDGGVRDNAAIVTRTQDRHWHMVVLQYREVYYPNRYRKPVMHQKKTSYSKKPANKKPRKPKTKPNRKKLLQEGDFDFDDMF